MSNKENAKKTSLKEFIDDNHNLLTVLGIFVALAALFSQKENSIPIVFFALVMSSILFLETYIQFPKWSQSSLILRIFQNLFSVMMFFIFGWVFYTYRTEMPIYSAIVFGPLCGYVCIRIMDRLEIYEKAKKVADKKRTYSKIISASPYILTVVMVSVVTYLLIMLVQIIVNFIP